MTATQLALLPTGRARRNDAPTAKAAAAAVDVPARCAEVLLYLRDLGPSSAADLAGTMMQGCASWAYPNVVSRRLLDLERKGLAQRVGTVVGHQGRSVLVYEAVES